MRVVIEVHSGCVVDAIADVPCELVVVDRDEIPAPRLHDGKLGTAELRNVRVDARAVARFIEDADDLN